MSDDEPEPVEDEEQPDEDGNPWAKTSSGDADEITDDGEDDRVLGDVGHRVGQQEGSGGDLQRADQVGEIDDRALR